MNFAQVLRDVDDQIVTVSSEEKTYLNRTVHLIYGETYKELQSLSDKFEESIKRPENARQYSENDPFCTETTIKTMETLNTKTEGHEEEEKTDMMTFYS